MVWPFLRAKSIGSTSRWRSQREHPPKWDVAPPQEGLSPSHQSVLFCIRFQYCLSKSPQTWWFKITEISPLTFLEVRRLRPVSMNQSPSADGGMLPPEALGQTLPCLFQLLAAAGISQLVVTSLESLLLSSLWYLLCVCVSLSYENTCGCVRVQLDNPWYYHHLKILYHICKGPFSKWGNISK